MAYNPSLHPRGPDGKFIRTGAIGPATKGMTGAKVKGPSKGRGKGRKGLKANFTPYVRVNKRSQTAGFNTGTIIPFAKHRRIVGGAYVRLESTKNKTVADRFVEKRAAKVFPAGSRRGRAARKIKSSVVVSAPLVRASYKGHQVRVGTSRGAGPTVIIRRGKHRTPEMKSMKGVHQYNKRMSQIAGKRATSKAKRRKARPQRRRAARKKR